MRPQTVGDLLDMQTLARLEKLKRSLLRRIQDLGNELAIVEAAIAEQKKLAALGVPLPADDEDEDEA